MHKYLVEIYKYTEAGALEPRPFVTKFADNEIQLMQIRDQYGYEMQTREVTDEDGNVTIEKTNNKMHKVKAKKLAYVNIPDLDAEINGIFQ